MKPRQRINNPRGIHQLALRRRVLPGKGQRRSWLAKLRNIFTRMTKVNCKSDEESQNLPHNGRKPVRSHPKRTISIYPQNEAGPGKTSGGGHVEGRGKKDKGVPRSLAVLMLSGAKDGVVPPAHMKTLWEAATAPFGDGSQCDAEAVEHEVLVGGPSRRGNNVERRRHMVGNNFLRPKAAST